MTFHASRRQFLLTSATAVGLATTRLMAKEPDVKIDRIDVWPVMYPTRGYFKFLTDARGVRGRTVVFVKVTADNGQVGWGQSIPSYRWSYETLETVTIVLRVKNGTLKVPTGPGLGIEVDAAKVAELVRATERSGRRGSS